jgi:hypothetical protein
MGRDISDSLSGLMVEWNVDAPSSWVWNDNQKGAAMDDQKVLTRLLQKNNVLPGEDDYLADGKKVLPVEALSSAYKKFLNADGSFVVQTLSYKGGKGKGKGGKSRTQEGKSKARWFRRNQLALISLCCPFLTSSIGRMELTFWKVPATTVSRFWLRERIGPLCGSIPCL